MIGVPCTYDPEQHYIFEPELLEWCRRQTSDEELKKELFVYKQMQVGTFVIARWIDRSLGFFVDLLNLGHVLSSFNHKTARELRRRVLAPVTSSATTSFLKTAESNHLSKLQKENDDTIERKAQLESNVYKAKGLYNT